MSRGCSFFNPLAAAIRSLISQGSGSVLHLASAVARAFMIFASTACLIFGASQARAAGAIVGPLCLDEVKAQSFPGQATIATDGQWIPWRFTENPARSGRIVIFDRAIIPSEALETCAEVIARMGTAGSTPILSGTIEKLRLDANLFSGTGNRFQINQGALKVTLAAVETGQRPIAGGTVELKGSKLWIEAPSRILSTGSKITGIFEIEAWDRTVRNAVIAMPGGLTYRSDLRPEDGGNLTIRLDLATGAAMLHKGRLSGAPILASAGDAQFDGFLLGQGDLTAAKVLVSATDGQVNVALKNLVGKAAIANIPGPLLALEYSEPKVSVENSTARANQLPGGFQLLPPRAQRVQISSVRTTLAASGGQEIFVGPGDSFFAEVNDQDTRGSTLWANPQAPNMQSLFAADMLTRVALSMQGSRANPVVGGQLNSTALSVGQIDLASQITIQIPESTLTTALTFPIHVDVPPGSGSVTFNNGEQTAALTGKLLGLYLDGKIFVPILDVAQSHLDVAKGDFRFGVGASASLTPFLAGTKPNFLDANLRVENSSALRVGKVSTGKVQISADTLLLAEPVFQVGENGTSAPASLDISSDGKVLLGYDIGAGMTEFLQGRLLAHDVKFSLIGQGAKVVDLGGYLLTDPTIELGNMVLEVDRLGANQRANGKIENLTIATPRLERKRTKEKGLGLSADAGANFVLGSLTAERVEIDDAIRFEAGELRNLSIAISRGRVELGQGIEFRKANIALSLDSFKQVVSDEETIAQIGGGRLNVSGDFRVRGNNLAINDAVGSRLQIRLSGRSDSLSGEGSLTIGAFTGHADSALSVSFPCKSGSDLEVPIEYNFGVGGAGMAVTMRDGELTGVAGTGPIGAVMHTKQPRSCDSETKKWVLVKKQEGWTYGVCSKWDGWRPKFWKCKWKWTTPEVNFQYHFRLAVEFANINAVLTGPKIYLRPGGTMNICAGGVGISPAIIIGGYSPQIDSNLPEADRVVNTLLAVTFESIQSVGYSAIATHATWLANVVGNTGSAAYCMVPVEGSL